MSAAHVICLLVPVKIISEANSREHWRKAAKRKAEHRNSARIALGGCLEIMRLPCTITLTRIGPRTLDDDNLASGFKAFRDGVADWLGIYDGSPLLTWRYAQRKGKPKEYAAEIHIEGRFCEA